MSRVHFYIAAFLFLLCCSGCKKPTAGYSSRGFLLGVTPWPPDFTEKGYNLAYDFINTNCDMVSHHFDDGVPWEEIYSGLALPQNLLDDVARRKQKTHSSRKILLSVAPLKISRTERTGYYASSTASKDLISQWNAKSFKDSSVITAYVKFISYLIDQLNPDYINYGVESNSGSWKTPDFEDYAYFLGQVYTRLRTRFPMKPFFISFMVVTDKGFLENARMLEPYTDWITLSAYPYTYIGSPVYGSSSPTLIPGNLFQSYRDINVHKPFAVAETGYIAQDLHVSGVSKEGNPQWQDDYLNYLFKFCQNNEARFIIWFCAYDYDDAINTFQALGEDQELSLIWEHTGLLTEKLAQRPAFQTWKAWRKLPVK